jgi:hypothetical protein
MVTDQQVQRLQRLALHGLPKERAADKAGLDPKTARKYRRLGKLSSEVRRMDRDYRMRPDPFAEVWSQLEELLRSNPGLEARTLFDDLQRRFPGRFADGQLRTLQRHVKRSRTTAIARICFPAVAFAWPTMCWRRSSRSVRPRSICRSCTWRHGRAKRLSRRRWRRCWTRAARSMPAW